MFKREKNIKLIFFGLLKYINPLDISSALVECLVKVIKFLNWRIFSCLEVLRDKKDEFQWGKGEVESEKEELVQQF